MDPNTFRLMQHSQSATAATYVQAAASTTNSGNNLVLSKPSSTTSGDLLVALIRSGGGDSGTYNSVPSGWTNVYTGGGDRVYVGYKTAGGSEPSTYNFGTGQSNAKCGTMLLFRGASWDTSKRTSGSFTAAEITVAVSNSILVAFFSEDGDGTYSNPSSGLVLINSNSDTTSGSYAVYYDDLYPSGSSGTKTVTCSQNSSPVTSVLISIKPS